MKITLLMILLPIGFFVTSAASRGVRLRRMRRELRPKLMELASI